MAVKFSKPPAPKVPGAEYADHLAPPPKYIGKQAVGKVTKDGPAKGLPPQEELHVLAVPKIPQDKLANLNMTVSRTYNLGNYESVKVNVSLTFPSHVDEINETYKFVEGWVDERMQEIENGMKGKP